MSKSSQKPTNGNLVRKSDLQVVRSGSQVSLIRSAVTGRFVGMAATTKKVPASIIPGYKTRG